MAKRLNTTLKNKEEITRYVDMGKAEGFVYRTDHAKNWDNFKAVAYVLDKHPERDSVILDAGGIVSSAFLPSLQRKGYVKMIGVFLFPINVLIGTPGLLQWTLRILFRQKFMITLFTLRETSHKHPIQRTTFMPLAVYL